MGISANSSNGPEKNPANDALLRKLVQEVEANLRNEQFSVENLADKMAMSRSHLHRKLKAATGKSVNQFIREHRLHRALEFLKTKDKSVSEIADEVGFGSASYFTTCFTEYYGYPPGEAKRKLNESRQADSIAEFKEVKKPSDGINKIAAGGLVVLALVISFLLYQLLASGSDSKDATTISNARSIAVLPFKNLNMDEENKYFSEGVVEAINRHLFRIGDLRVISLTSTDRYRESHKSAQEIGGELNVSNLLEGSIQRHENTVRIEVRLIDASTEVQVWSENYDRELKDIFKTQSEIAEKVALALKAKLSPEEKAVLSQKITDNAEAYDLYLKGNYEFRTYTRNGNHRAIEYFKQAVALDSNYALAYSGLATSYIAKASIFGAELTGKQAMALAKPFLDKALALDPDLIEAHLWNGFYLLYNNWDFKGAEQEYKKSSATNNPDALAVYADFLNFTRRHEEALAICKKLQQSNPYYPNSRMILSLYYLGRYDEAAESAESRMRLFHNYTTLDSYGFLMLNTGRYQEAIQLFQRGVNLEGVRYPRMLGWMGAAYAHAGQKQKALELLEELKTKRAHTDAGSLSFFIAVIHAALGDKAAALRSLQDAFNKREMEMPWLKSEPQFFPLQDDPAFQSLLKKVGFP
jgi:TolB-like protein/AraC-like DNA-binding protein